MPVFRTSLALLVFTVVFLASDSARAFPDGAPWGAANPAAEQDCAACHFGNKPVSASKALKLEGLPETPEAGETYALTVTFDHPDLVIAGFQLLAVADGDGAGSITASSDDVEFIGAAIRSIAPFRDHGPAEWQFAWRAPESLPSSIDFLLAASAANDDGSPFGDTIHYRAYRLCAPSACRCSSLTSRSGS